MKHLIVIMLFAGVTACKNQSNRDSVKIAKESNRDKADTSTNMNTDTAAATMAVERADADFSVEAANDNMIAIQLGALAKTKAVKDRVKSFASMMITDHKKISEHLQKIAASKNISLPQELSSEAQKDINRLNKKNGIDFDRSYINRMVADNKNDVNKFEKAAKNCKDPDLKNFIEQTLPLLRIHLDSARAIDKLFVVGARSVTSPEYQ